MGIINPNPEDFGAVFDEIFRRLSTLETAARLPNISTSASGIQAATISTLEGTSSAAYTDLATVGPTCTVTVSEVGKLVAIFSAQFFGSSGVNDTRMSLHITQSNGTVTLPSDANATGSVEGLPSQHSLALVYTVAPGVTVVRAKYKKLGGGGDAFFSDRDLIVIPL